MKEAVMLLCFVAFLCSGFCRGSDELRKLEALDNLMGDEEQRNMEQLQDKIERDSNQHPLGDEDEEGKLRNQEKADEVTATKNQNPNGQEAFPYKGFSDEDEANDGDVYGVEKPDYAAADLDKRLESARQESNYGSKEGSDELEDTIPEPAKDNLDQNGADDVDDISDDSTFARERRWFWGSRRRGTSRRRSSSSRRVTPVACRSCNVCDLTREKGARVHTGFLSAWRQINSYAAACNVKIYVTSSFRKINRPIVGGIVPQATRSNHFVGHAIDMNLIYGPERRWCNSACLGRAKPPSPVSCFINKIRANPGLRWGGDFSRRDVVHIDDGYNLRQSASYSRLYQEVQKNCR